MLIFLSKADYPSDEITHKAIDEYCRLYNIQKPQYNIVRKQDKKPALEPPFLQFNLSHSGEYKTVAVSEVAVGIDIQQHKPCDFEAISDRFFAKKVSGQKQFFDLWAAKEARAKCSGDPLIKVLKEEGADGATLFNILDGYSLAVKSSDKEILFMFLF
jgi:phosphopantetheinyl transferase